jgi:hypothetical protein
MNRGCRTSATCSIGVGPDAVLLSGREMCEAYPALSGRRSRSCRSSGSGSRGRSAGPFGRRPWHAKAARQLLYRSTPTVASTGGRSQNVIADRARPQISWQRGPARTRLRLQLTPRPRCGDPQAKTHPRPIGAAPAGQQAFPIRPSKGPEPLKDKRPTAVPFQEVTVHREMSSVPQDWADSGAVRRAASIDELFCRE